MRNENAVIDSMSISEETQVYVNNKMEMVKEVSHKNVIRQELRGNGFKVNNALVACMERLDAMTGEHNTLRDIKELAKNPDTSADTKEIVKEIVDDLQQQELARMQAPELPAVEPA